jgi:hypothetical protein
LFKCRESRSLKLAAFAAFAGPAQRFAPRLTGQKRAGRCFSSINAPLSQLQNQFSLYAAPAPRQSCRNKKHLRGTEFHGHEEA